MNISWLPFKPQISRFFNMILPEDMVVSIFQGKLKGKKWYVRSSNLEFALGNYEPELRTLLEENVIENSTFYDIGANVGFFTLLSSFLVGDDGKVVAFEPLPRNLHYVKEHLKINNCTNAEVIEAAVSDKSGFTYFDTGHGVCTGHITEDSDNDALKVQTVCIDDIILENKIPGPDCMKIDVEGAEFLVLKGASKTLNDYKPVIFLETHSKELENECSNFLKSKGYNLKFLKMEGKIKKQIYAY